MSGNGFSLIDQKGLSEPVTKLVDTVSSGVGILYEPTRIRRKARAEADAAIILARGDEKFKKLTCVQLSGLLATNCAARKTLNL